MANTEAELRGLLLNAVELKNISGWPDALVEDYLNIIENIVTVATAVDTDTNNIDDINQQISTLGVRIGKLKAMISRIYIDNDQIVANTENILNINQSINVYPGMINKNKARINNIIKMIENMLQLQQVNMGSAKNRANLNKQQRELNNFEQLLYVR